MSCFRTSSSSLLSAAILALAPLASSQSIARVIGPEGDGLGNPLESPTAGCVDQFGSYYVVGYDSNNVFKVTDGGVVTEIIDFFAGGGSWEHLLDPQDVAVHASGNVYTVAMGSNNAFRITPDGVITEIIDSSGDGSSTLATARRIDVDDQENVYVTGWSSDNAFRIGTNGEIVKIIDASGDGAGHGLDCAHGVAVAASGNVYVVGAVSRNVFRITPGGVITQIIDSTGDGSGATLSVPSWVAVDSQCNVYVCAAGTHNAFKITPRGVITEIIDASGDGAGHSLSNPRGIAVGPLGHVFVTGGVSDNAFAIGEPWPAPPGVGYCFGDPGSGTPCPCGNDNDGSVPGSGCDNGAFASGARLTGFGDASVGEDTVILTTTHAEPFSAGLYFQGKHDLSPGIVWGDGLRCAGGGEARLQVRFADAAGTSSTTISLDQRPAEGKV